MLKETMGNFRIAFFKGKGSLMDNTIRWWENGPYSHVELVFSDGTWGTAYTGKGVILWERDGLPENWDFIDLPAHLEQSARKWFEDHLGKSYDYVGLARFVFGFLNVSRDKWFCSRACADALGLTDGWREDPNGLYAEVKSMFTVQ